MFRTVVVTLGLLYCAAVVKADYDEALARRILFLASAAYAPDATPCLNKHFSNVELISQVEVECDKSLNNTCSAFFALLHDEKAIVLSFRGSVGDDQVERELLAILTLRQKFRNLNVEINEYFDETFAALWNGVLNETLAQLGSQYPDYKLWITGHSLGAGLASMAGLVAISEGNGRWNNSNTVNYNYGKPRVGGVSYAHLHNQVIPDAYRVVHNADTITNFYPLLFGYVHEHNWIWYNNNMTETDTYIACSGELDLKCQGFHLLNLSDLWYDHRHYFGLTVPDYGASNCTVNAD